MIDRTLQPGDITHITEAQASELLGLEPTGFFVGYDDPDFEYFHAPREVQTTATKGET